MKEVDVLELFHKIDKISSLDDVKDCLFSFLSLWIEIYELENERRKALSNLIALADKGHDYVKRLISDAQDGGGV